MYTQCPKCRTIFEIDEAALQAALGIVRCGHCSERFDALRTLSGELPAGPDASLPDRDPEQLTPVLTQAIAPTEAGRHAPPREPANDAPPAAAEPAPPATEPVASHADALPGPFTAGATRALVADVVGVPPGAVCGDPAWLVTGLAQQPHSADAGLVRFGPVARAAATSPDLDCADRVIESRTADVDAAAVSVPETSTPAHAPDATRPPDANTGDDARAESPLVSVGTSDAAEDGSAGAAEPTSAPDASASVALLPHVPEDSKAPATETAAGDRRDNADAADPEAEPATDPVSIGAGESADEAAVVPVYVAPHRRRVRRSSVLFALGCVALALVLAAQIAWARRVALVRNPATQAWALGVCAKLDCRLPPIRDVAKLELLSRDVRTEPGPAHALVVTATLRNNAAFRQPWPVVAVRLTNLDNDVIAMRRVRPAEYLPDAARRGAGLAPGATAAVVFELTDPGQRATGFRFSFE